MLIAEIAGRFISFRVEKFHPGMIPPLLILSLQMEKSV